MTQAEFDRFATGYDEDLAKSLAVTGESREFYAQARIDWTAERVAELGCQPRDILDYGCGDGANSPMLRVRFKADHVLGVDVSTASIAVARQAAYGAGTSFLSTSEWRPGGAVDLAFSNGVFHHIPPAEREPCLGAIRQALRRGGLLALWENNPWNPGTHYVMAKCAFDENAIKISPRAARKLLVKSGFKILQTDSLFYFPRPLRGLRVAERWLSWLPLGGQYLVLCQNPE